MRIYGGWSFDTLSFGADYAATGILRLPNNQTIMARNAANNADIPIMKLNASNQIEIGQTGNGLTIPGTLGVTGKTTVQALNEAFVLKASVAGAAVYQAFKNSADGDRGYFGFGGTSNSTMHCVNYEGQMDFSPSGTLALRLQSTLVQALQNVTLEATKKLYLDGGGDTYIHESSANVLDFVVANTTSFRITSSYLLSEKAYSNTTGSGANLVVATDGTFQRSTSARKYKADIRPLLNPRLVLGLEPVVYRSRNERDGKRDFVGFIADDAHERGLGSLVTYGANDEVEGFMYERVTAYLVGLAKEQDAKLTSHTVQIDALTARLEALEGKKK